MLNSTEVTVKRERSTCTIERGEGLCGSLLNNHNCFCNGHNELYGHSDHGYAQFHSMNHHHCARSDLLFFSSPVLFHSLCFSVLCYFITIFGLCMYTCTSLYNSWDVVTKIDPLGNKWENRVGGLVCSLNFYASSVDKERVKTKKINRQKI